MPIVSLQDLLDADVDVLVVGGGTCGLATATRLAQNRPNIVIAVIEAGDYHENDPLVDIPGMMSRAIHNPKYDWTYYTVPQKHAGNRQILQSHGKGLGGSSLLNFFGFVRPSKEELDAIEKLGNVGWNWDSLSAYMKKSERVQTPDESVDGQRVAASPDPKNHGYEGPIAKSYPPHITEIHAPLLDSLECMGVPRNPDNSGGRPVGAFLAPTSVDSKTATRSYSASGYYAPNEHLPNLLVLTGALTTKINFTAGADGLQKAVSVNIEKDGVKSTVNVKKEVLLSAGSLHTPQLLELSGVGSPKILAPLGIDTIIDLPGVGENLQDHALAPTVVEVDQSFKTFEIFGDPEQLADQQKLYAERKGLLAGVSSCFAFMPAAAFGTEANLADWEKSASVSAIPEFDALHPSVRLGMEKQYEILRGWLKDPNQVFSQILTVNGHYPVAGVTPDPTKRYTTLLVAYMHPFTRGRVHITSTNPKAHPDLDPKYLANPADSGVLASMISFMRRLFKTGPIAESIQSVTVPPFDEDTPIEEVNRFVADTLATVHHPVGTASMLPKELGGVVDSRLRVYGSENLRVVDCSIIPLELSCNIQSVAYAIGEKAADIILSEASLLP
ncbi:related to Glucose dehydrogenase [acceptor] precursor [Armillaria ostoyae]|uniref:Related to Glucose dehydrogenase [acceptor] n=1 Tax=Armillaria ostoyae TaxID=47428 RepID=A0A284RW48_ARMOS|nr:related to Glucose dehydrogenase [acceptor] precursor [Armillaria ostoyae]